MHRTFLSKRKLIKLPIPYYEEHQISFTFTYTVNSFSFTREDETLMNIKFKQIIDSNTSANEKRLTVNSWNPSSGE